MTDIDRNTSTDVLEHAKSCLRSNDVLGALRHCRNALSSQPVAIDILAVFGVAACLSGQSRDALPILRLALSARPDDPNLLNAVSIALRDAGYAEQACQHARDALAIDPEKEQFQRSLAESLFAFKKYEDARDAFLRMIQKGTMKPKDYATLGLSYDRLGQHERAVEHFRQAESCGWKDPAFMRAYASTLEKLKCRREAVDILKSALSAHPTDKDLAVDLGTIYYRGGNTHKALQIFRYCVREDPDHARGHINLGLALGTIGKPRQGIAHFETCVRLSKSIAAHSNLIFYANYICDVSPQKLGRLHKIWWNRHGASRVPAQQAWTNAPDPTRRLRIGYVSPDFRAHSCAYFLLGLLKHHNHADFEIFAYMTHPIQDTVSDRIKGLVDHWHDADPALERRIKKDQIDILIDLTGHTAGHSLLLFARKPTPVQVTWLGYPTTTGVETIDWRISDPWLTPEGTRENFSEHLYRLPRISHCYTPEVNHFGLPDVRPLPCDSNGYLTFGSFNNLAKISPTCLAFWVRVLEAVPDARLRIKSRTIADPEARENLIKGFADAGGDVSRLDIAGGTEKKDDHLTQIGEVDIALDTYPYGGMTTTCETLMMGVPVLSLVGERTASRYGLSVLTAVGLPELAGHTVDEVVAAAVALNEDRDRLRDLRAGLRDQVLASPLCDHAGFARAMEAAYRDMWTQWCASQTPTPR